MIRSIFIVLLLSVQCLSAQEITLNFPHFAGQKYYFWIFRGNNKDTISSGQLDQYGKAKLIIPHKLKNYRGMAQWSLVEGGGLDIILAGEKKFSISCVEEQPSEDNIIYNVSPENTYTFICYNRQQEILKKIDIMYMAEDAYNNDSILLSIFNTERKKQQQAYNLLLEERDKEGLYAAHLTQIIDITRGLSPKPFIGREDNFIQLKKFVVEDLDFEILYTSGHWESVLYQFSNWYNIDQDKYINEFIPDVIKILNRIRNEDIYISFAEYIINHCEKHNRYNQELELAFFLLNDNKIIVPKGKIQSLYTLLKIHKGIKAPALSLGLLPKKKIILAFHDSGCGNCIIQMDKLIKLYPQLIQQGYEVVSISADLDIYIYENYARKMPWKHKYCDFRGFDGKDFLNYGIIGTPTFYQIDEEGIVRGRYVQVEDIDFNN